METLTNKGVTCFLRKSNKHRRYYVKKNPNVCWHSTSRSFNARTETRDATVVEQLGFHCHVEKALNASATVLYAPRAREKHRNSICAFVCNQCASVIRPSPHYTLWNAELIRLTEGIVFFQTLVALKRRVVLCGTGDYGKSRLWCVAAWLSGKQRHSKCS